MPDQLSWNLTAFLSNFVIEGQPDIETFEFTQKFYIFYETKLVEGWTQTVVTAYYFHIKLW